MTRICLICRCESDDTEWQNKRNYCLACAEFLDEFSGPLFVHPSVQTWIDVVTKTILDVFRCVADLEGRNRESGQARLRAHDAIIITTLRVLRCLEYDNLFPRSCSFGFSGSKRIVVTYKGKRSKVASERRLRVYVFQDLYKFWRLSNYYIYGGPLWYFDDKLIYASEDDNYSKQRNALATEILKTCGHDYKFEHGVFKMENCLDFPFDVQELDLPKLSEILQLYMCNDVVRICMKYYAVVQNAEPLHEWHCKLDEELLAGK